MPTIFAANESSVMVEGKAVEGVRSIAYRKQQARENVYSLGSAERIGLVSGPQVVEGKLTVASTSPGLDGIDDTKSFSVIATLKHADKQMTVTFDECYLTSKDFDMSVGTHGEATYSFTATRVREEMK
jgi:hypothetical protein